MNTQIKGPKMYRWAGIFVMFFAMTVFLVPKIQAADEVAYRATYHTIKVEMKEVGDVPGHIIGVTEHAGLGFFTKGPGSGEIATRTSTSHFDTVKGKGTFTTDVVYTFRDGSTQSTRSIGTITPVDGGKRSVSEGTYEVSGGTGRFAGLTGKGTWKAERLGPRETGSDGYVDAIGTVEKKMSMNERPVMEATGAPSFGTEDWIGPEEQGPVVAVKSPSFGTEDWTGTMESSEALGAGAIPEPASEKLNLDDYNPD